MMRSIGRLSVLVIALLTAHPLPGAESPRWTVAPVPWEERLGSQRAVVHIPSAGTAVSLDFLWRRHDRDPARRRLTLIGPAGDTVRNIHRLVVDSERCSIVFGPVASGGVYYLYYLPYDAQEGWGYFSRDYLPPERPPDRHWLQGLAGDSTHGPSARALVSSCTEIQSRTAFDSFFPMELIPTAAEKAHFLSHAGDDYLLFAEDRSLPVRMKDEIPYAWISRQPGALFEGHAHRNEYYAFQIALYAAGRSAEQVTVDFSDLTAGDGARLSASALTCFNTGGVDPYGSTFTKRVDVPRGHVQAFWMGVDIPSDVRPATYTGTVTLTPHHAAALRMPVAITIDDSVLSDRGDGEPWRHSRLRWLNSTAGIDMHPVPPYTPVAVTGEAVKVLGRSIDLAPSVLPRQISAWGRRLLSSPMRLVMLGERDREIPIRWDKSAPRRIADGAAVAASHGRGDGFEITGHAMVEFDGYTLVRFALRASTDLHLADIRLETPMTEEAGELMMGMGEPGRTVPDSITMHWGGPHDSFWVGSASAGLWCELRGASYSGPLLNLYHPAPPERWANGGRGKITIQRRAGTVLTTVSAGARSMVRGDSIVFELALLPTPVKPRDTSSQFRDRYYHNGLAPVPTEQALAAGVRIVNVHHANEYNPYINYPFIAQAELRGLTSQLHARGIRTKIYYTVREITNHVTEFWALRSLGDEIIADGTGGGFPWLREHCIDGYTPQWYQHYPTKPSDASLLTAAGASRWYNYYIEGLGWLVRNMDIDGLYLDDVAFDRRILKRMKKVMEANKRGCIMDLHSNTWFSHGPAMQYAEFFPFINKLWFGEWFRYNEMTPEAWLIETSGIPFGLMGDMLQDGGNRWLGMVYGMTARLPWVTESITADPTPVWKLWDAFGIADARMIGYWEKEAPVRSTYPSVRVTAYVRPGRTLLALGNWSTLPVKTTLIIDWKALGLDPKGVRLVAPAIADFQPERVFRPGETIPVEGKKGWLILLSRSP